MKRKLSFVLFCLLFTIKLCFGQTGNPILIDTAKSYSISEHGYFYEDKKLKATSLGYLGFILATIKILFFAAVIDCSSPQTS